jgi:hypothetical protein
VHVLLNIKKLIYSFAFVHDWAMMDFGLTKRLSIKIARKVKIPFTPGA